MASTKTITLLQGRLKLELLPKMAYSANDPSELETLGISLERQRGVHAIESDRRVDFDTWPGVLAFTPPGVRVFSESAEGGEYVVARWSNQLLPRARAASTQRRQMSGHAAALKLGMKLRKQMLASDIDSLLIEDLALQFVCLHLAIGPSRRTANTSYFARVLEQIAAEFSQPLSLADMAATVKSTEIGFLREFRKVIGMTPHAYLLETRVQAARRLIERGDLSLAAIAADCGFSHQSHLGDAFRRSLGLTPGEYKRGLSKATSSTAAKHVWTPATTPSATAPQSRT